MLSDLELVAQAMQTPSTSAPDNIQSSSAQPDVVATSKLPPDIAASLKTLSASDLASLGPLLSALEPSDGTQLEQLSDAEIERLLSQMDVAGGIADDLEGRLDKLLESLGGGLGEDLEEDQEAGVEVEAQRGEKRSGEVEEDKVNREKKDIKEIAEKVGEAKERDQAQD